MTTLKDLIHDEVMEYHNEKDVADAPQVLTDAIMDVIKHFFETQGGWE